MLSGDPLLWTGADDGACRVPELLGLLEVLELPDEPEFPGDPVLPEDAAPRDDPVLACVEPGSRIATSPAAATLAAEIAAVVLVSQRRPRSRSATAPATLDAPLRNCGVLMLKA